MTTFRGLTLYPFQREAAASINAGHSLLVAAPTGAGKTLVADYAIEHAFERGERIIYTSPIKALSNQKFRDFREIHGDDVGIMTGDVTINGNASLVIMTTEVFRNTIFEDAERLGSVGAVIYDEIHYLDDAERGTVWEESIIYAPTHIRVIGLSATIPNVAELAEWMEQERETRFDVIEMSKRPVPLMHHICLPNRDPMTFKEVKAFVNSGKFQPDKRINRYASRRVIDTLVKHKMLPCLYFAFSRKDCEIRARENARRQLLSPDEQEKIRSLYDDLCERYQVNDDKLRATIGHFVEHGIMYHHAGLMPVFKEIAERLFCSGLIKMLFATETFALGVNMPARSVVFNALKKYDGVSFDFMKTRDYWQMAGRAGRQGIDEVGDVFSIIDPRDLHLPSIERIIFGTPEPVLSRFNLDYSAVLCLYERLGERVVESYDRSFARFQRARSKPEQKKPEGGRRKRGRRRGRSSKPRESRLIRLRLKILEATGYIEDGKLTKKGAFASTVNGYEVQAAELLHYGVFHLCDEVQLCILIVAMIYEARRGHASRQMDRNVMQEIIGLTDKRMVQFRRREFESGLENVTPAPDFTMSAVVHAWATGHTFDELRGLTNISDGDLVRNFRLAIQLLRNIRHSVKGEADLAAKFDAAMDLLNRDEIDAKRQLELG